MPQAFAKNSNSVLVGTFGQHNKRESRLLAERIYGDSLYEEVNIKREREIRALKALMHQRHSFCG